MAFAAMLPVVLLAPVFLIALLLGVVGTLVGGMY